MMEGRVKPFRAVVLSHSQRSHLIPVWSQEYARARANAELSRTYYCHRIPPL